MTDAAHPAFPEQIGIRRRLTKREYMTTHILAGLLANDQLGLGESQELAEVAAIQTEELIRVLQEYNRDDEDIGDE